MNKLTTLTLLAALAGTSLVPTVVQAQAATSEKMQVPAAPDLMKPQAEYFKSMSNIIKKFRVTLEALNKEKGSDPAVYKRIAAVDADLDQLEKTIASQKPTDSIAAFNTEAETVSGDLTTARREIGTITKMKAKVQATLPGKCVAFKNKPGGIKGNVELSGTRKFTFQPLDGSKPYTISTQAGWTDGNAYIPNRGHATGYLEGNEIICIER